AFLFVPSEALGPGFRLLALSLLPIFLAGLAEDLGFGVSVRGRLIAAAISAALAALLLHTWIDKVDLPGVDFLLGLAPFAILFTVFASAGVCNAFNLIDGMNGLASGTGILVAIGLGYIARKAGAPDFANVAFAMAPAIFGFFLFNFPAGKIFLGDAGAYSMGHALVWTAILLVAHSAEISPWAVVLVFFWPLADTLFAIYRRSRSGRPLGQPDQMHFHQLAMRGIEIGIVGPGHRHVANALATTMLLPLIGMPILTGVWLWNNSAAAMAAVAIYGIAFAAAYRIGLFYFRRHARAHRKHRNGKSQEKSARTKAG
ncbi:MraY family glycosyltransferase, partial [Phaeovulum sp.]|uniref:MraY family glycosyltransferase n=1 Tax=Phaeovulum sp. TaxID=2934796 RepID=UPI002731BA12